MFVPGVYHVWARGSNRQLIFLADADRLDFLTCLDDALARRGARCLAYVFMTNHYHLVLETADGALSALMKALNGRYALRFNRRHGRDAHLFRNRFGARLQETTEQLAWTLRYVVRNPVDSGLCGAPEEWEWSSYRATAGLEPAPRFLARERVLSYFADEPHRAMALYRAYVDGLVGV